MTKLNYGMIPQRPMCSCGRRPVEPDMDLCVYCREDYEDERRRDEWFESGAYERYLDMKDPDEGFR